MQVASSSPYAPGAATPAGSPARPPPITNFTVRSPDHPFAPASGKKTNRDTEDDSWTYQAVKSNVTRPFLPVPTQEEQQQQDTIVVSSLQLAAAQGTGTTHEAENVTGVCHCIDHWNSRATLAT